MKKCSFSELSQKEVINTCDCRRLGVITDLIFDLECGRIISVIVCTGTAAFCFGKSNDKCITIPWECIKKIGDDIILTDIVVPELPQKCEKPKKDKRIFFSD